MNEHEAIFARILGSDDADALAEIRRLSEKLGTLRSIGLDEEGMSLLTRAVQYDRAVIVQALIAAGMTLDAEANAGMVARFETAVHVATDRDGVDMLLTLLGAGGQRFVNTFDEVARTPLHVAVGRRSLQRAHVLLGAGADPNAQDEERIGNPPLREDKLTVPMAKLLLDAGADPTREGSMRRTALDDAARANEDGRELLDLYLEHLGWSRAQLDSFLAR